MKSSQDVSFGIIPLKCRLGRWKVLLIQHGAGHWAFPKGHAEKGELPKETAARELKEETGLIIKHFLPLPSLKEHYFFTSKQTLINKTVEYWCAKVTGKAIPQQEEISKVGWFTFEEAYEKATFPATKTLIIKIKEIVAL